MQINKAKFERVVEEANAKAANDPKWLRAIEKAAAATPSATTARPRGLRR